MNYYNELFKREGTLLLDIWNYIIADETDRTIKTILLVLFTLSLISTLYIVVKHTAGHDPKFGTAGFWIAVSVCTLGLGAIVIACVFRFAEKHKNYMYPYKAEPYLFLPAWVSVVSYYILHIKQFDTVKDKLLISQLAGLSMFLLLMIANLFSNSNSAVNFLVPGKQKIDSAIKYVSADLERRKRAGMRSENVYELEGEKVCLKTIRSKELKKYLLVNEIYSDCLYKEYRKYDGSKFKVAELESMYIPKIYDCIAGLLIWMVVTTPYLSKVMEQLISILW